jgi:hypothetical protein
MRRFRTVPRQPEALPYVLAHIARACVTRVEAGWTWRFDPKIFGHDRLPLRTCLNHHGVFPSELQ